MILLFADGEQHISVDCLFNKMLKLIVYAAGHHGEAGCGDQLGQLGARKRENIVAQRHCTAGAEGFAPCRQHARHHVQEGFCFLPGLRGVLDAIGKIAYDDIGGRFAHEAICKAGIAVE